MQCLLHTIRHNMHALYAWIKIGKRKSRNRFIANSTDFNTIRHLTHKPAKNNMIYLYTNIT